MCFSRNVNHILSLCQWNRLASLEAMTLNTPRQERRRVRALLWALEVRKVRVSVLAAPLSRIFGIRLTDLLHRDLSACALDGRSARAVWLRCPGGDRPPDRRTHGRVNQRE